MPIPAILRYTLTSLAAALVICAIYLLIRRVRSKKSLNRFERVKLFMIGYVAALLQITALRISLIVPSPFSGDVNLIPGAPLQRALLRGVWPFVYNVCGNVLWFVPMGIGLQILRPRAKWWQALLLGASLSGLIELTQFILGTGTCDIDDVLLNAAGCLMGWGLSTILRRRRRTS